MPCPPPPGGWRPYTGYASSEEQIGPSQSLTEYVAGHRDQFTDIWQAHPGDDPVGASVPSVSLLVVGTDGDVTRASQDLGAIYAGNLCVHRVRHSAADLQRIADRLTGISATPIAAFPLTVENLVQVTVVALDPSTVAILDQIGRDVLRIEAPLLRPR